MNNRIAILFAFGSMLFSSAQAQTYIPVPPILEGAAIDLAVQNGTSNIFPGIQTQTIGYNGAMLGPTLLLTKGQFVTLHVHNQLNEMTTVHWHGLHVAPSNDGSPHNPILPGETWSPGFEVMDQAGTYWYHPHPHSMTMMQVIRGAAGLIIVRDDAEAALLLPRTYGVDDVPLVFQWKTFDAAGQLVEMDDSDNEVLVNGVLNGVRELPAQVTRLRLLNGSSHRYMNLGFADNMSFHQIAGDAGLLDAPVQLTRLILAPGERAEILVNLSGKEGQTLTLRQYGTQLPQGYPGGPMMMGGGMMGPKDNTNFDLMKAQVAAPAANNPINTIPVTLATNQPWPQVGAGARTLQFSAQPMMSMTNFFINGVKFDMETINFTVEQGKTEIWTVTNQTMMAHPLHIHGNSFYILSVNGAVPPPNQRGRKDVVTVPPMNGQVKLIMKYEDFSDPDVPYMYHCHILSHEDNGMMGQFIVNPAPTAASDPTADTAVRVYPNPLDKNASLTISANEAIGSVAWYDLTGKKLLEQRYATGNLLNVHPGLLPGMYLMEVRTENGVRTHKLVIQD